VRGERTSGRAKERRGAALERQLAEVKKARGSSTNFPYSHHPRSLATTHATMASRSASRPRTASTATSSTDDPALRNRFVRVELVSFQVRTGGLAAIVPGNHNNGYLHFALSDGCDTASQVLRWNSDGRSLLFPSHYSNKLLFTGPNERRELRVCVVLCKEDDAAARTARAKFASTMLGDVLAVASPAAAIPTYGPAVQAAVDLSRTALTLATAAADVVETFVSDHGTSRASCRCRELHSGREHSRDVEGLLDHGH